MTLAHSLAIAGAALLASPQDVGEAHRIVFAPEANARIGKSIRVEHVLDTQVFGVDVGAEAAQELSRLKLTTSETLTVDDEYRASANGRPTSLRRVYREILHDVRAFAPGGSEPVVHLTATSPMKDLSVLFTWVPEENGYGRLYDAREGVEESLAALSEDLDLRELLPPRAVRVGERWEIEPSRLAETLAVGGKLPLAWSPEPEDPSLRNIATGVGGALYEVFGDAVRGRVAAELAEVAREGGDEIARIGVTIELETSRDQTTLLRNRMTRAEVMRGRVVTRAQILYRLDARAKLAWNLTHARVHAFELDGVETVEREIDVGGGSKSGGQTERARCNGPLKITLRVVPPRASEPAPFEENTPVAPAPDDGDER